MPPQDPTSEQSSGVPVKSVSHDAVMPGEVGSVVTTGIFDEIDSVDPLADVKIIRVDVDDVFGRLGNADWVDECSVVISDVGYDLVDSMSDSR